jgi:pilus assembly protein CpaB
MLTQTISGEGQSLNTAETVLKNLRVLATDQSTETITDENGKTVVQAFRTVTLEATPRIAEKITVAQTIGTISLSLRSIADNQSELERAIASGDIEVPEGVSGAEEEKLLRRAMARPQDGTTSFVTGGDVSRFQRRTIPAQTAQNAPAPANGAPGATAATTHKGPIVRVTRGQTTTVEPVGRGAGELRDRQAAAIGSAAGTVPAGLSTLR